MSGTEDSVSTRSGVGAPTPQSRVGLFFLAGRAQGPALAISVDIATFSGCPVLAVSARAGLFPSPVAVDGFCVLVDL